MLYVQVFRFYKQNSSLRRIFVLSKNVVPSGRNISFADVYYGPEYVQNALVLLLGSPRAWGMEM